MPLYAPPVFQAIPVDVVSAFDPRVFGGAQAWTANLARGVRVVCRKGGILHDLAIAVAVSSGNIAVAVYDTGEAVAGSRSLLYSTGSIACPAAASSTAQIVGDPNIAVAAGQQLEFMLACDNATATFYRYAAGAGPEAYMPSGSWVAPGGALPKLAFTWAGGFPLSGAVTEANVGSSSVSPFIIARIT